MAAWVRARTPPHNDTSPLDVSPRWAIDSPSFDSPEFSHVTRDSRTARPASEKLATHRDRFLEIVGVAVIVVAAVMTAVLGGSSTVVVAVTVVTSLLVVALMLHWAKERHRQVTDWYQTCESEIDQWQHRWQKLHEEAEQATSTLSLMRDGVIVLSPTIEILLINPSARRLLNLTSAQELDGRPFGEVVRIPDLTRAVAATRAGDGTQKLLVEVSAGNRVRPVKIRVDRFTAVGDNNLLMTLRDVTEAQRVEEMRREFIANISHELKTPLAAIKGYAETVELAIKDDPDAAVHFMTQIHTQCLRLERLIADMMQLARAQAGRSQLNISDVSMGDVIRESLESYQPIAESKEIELVIATPDPEARVRSDPEATLTIANNLIGNAIHYTPAGGKVTVSCRQAGRFWSLVVEDTGVGIPLSEQKRIFERFYRVEKSRSSGDGGTGIGLSIVKNLAMTLGGEVRVSSKPGEGAKFEVLLPSCVTSVGRG